MEEPSNCSRMVALSAFTCLDDFFSERPLHCHFGAPVFDERKKILQNTCGSHGSRMVLSLGTVPPSLLTSFVAFP